MLPIYGADFIQMYLNSSIGNVQPHIYQLAEAAYRRMVVDGSSQAVIISGESGAGKTEAAKLILNCILRMSSSVDFFFFFLHVGFNVNTLVSDTSAVSGNSGDTQRVKDCIMSTNPLLESFGNAKTVRNNNSSRFGKYIEILFNDKGEPCGGQITIFLARKDASCFPGKGRAKLSHLLRIARGRF